MELAAARATIARPAATIGGSGADRPARGADAGSGAWQRSRHSGGISANVWASCMPWLRRYSRTPM